MTLQLFNSLTDYIFKNDIFSAIIETSPDNSSIMCFDRKNKKCFKSSEQIKESEARALLNYIHHITFPEDSVSFETSTHVVGTFMHLCGAEMVSFRYQAVPLYPEGTALLLRNLNLEKHHDI